MVIPYLHLMNEVYRSIKGWSNFLVSNLGNVKSIDRIEKWMGTTRPRSGRQMKTRVLRLYFCVGLKQGCRSKTFFVHRLVAEAFIDNPNNYPIVNHIDNNRLNNRADNLEWCTQKMNIAHAMKADNWTRGEGHGNAKFTDEDIKRIRSFPTGSLALAKEYGVTYSTIKRIRRRESWNHL